MRTGILTLSDRASKGEYKDRSGPAVKEVLAEWLMPTPEWHYAVLPDERYALEQHLRDYADQKQCSLICTTGGTGPAPRDITPEVTEAVCDKMLPGFGELMRRVSLQVVPTAILSRQTAGIRGSSLIINLPGNPKAIRECLEPVLPAVPDALDLIGAPRIDLNPEKHKTYRPH